MEGHMSPQDKAAEYFRSILLRKSPNGSYPILRLVGHRCNAPDDVYNVIVNGKDLKALFMNYPDLFNVQGDAVSLVTEHGVEYVGDTMPYLLDVGDEACKFYQSVLSNVSKFCPYPIAELKTHRNKAPEPVKHAIPSRSEWNTFLKQYSNIFTVYKHYVVLTEAVDVINDTVSHFVSLLKSNPNKISTFTALMNIPTKPACVKTAVRSNTQLKKLLSCFSTTFKVNNNSVALIGNQSFIAGKINGKQNLAVSITDSLEVSGRVSDASTVASSGDLTAVIQDLKNMSMNAKNKEDDFLKQKAALFFSEKLWAYKTFKVVPIVDLFECKVWASAEIKAICGKGLKEFKEFLISCNDTFIVTGEYVLARKNIPKKDWCPPPKGIEEELCSVLHNFFKMYTRNGKPEHIGKLFNELGKCFLNGSGEKFFHTPNDLANFLGMFPESFYIFNDHVVNILNYDKECVKEVSRKKSKRTLNESYEPEGVLPCEGMDSWKEKVLSKTEHITDLETCKEITNNILKNEKVIALDCEGVNLGADGILTLIQIGIESGKVYIFDIIEDRDMVIEGNLKAICESANILKVIHDCRNDSANLWFEYEVVLRNIFDTRIAHGLIIKEHNKPIGFNKLCELYRAPINVTKDEFKDVYKFNPGFWLNRPLTPIMKAYAALDVACLVPHVYNSMREKLEGLESKVSTLSEKASKSYL